MYNSSAEQSYVAQQLERSDRLEWMAWTCTGERAREKHTGEKKKKVGSYRKAGIQLQFEGQ